MSDASKKDPFVYERTVTVEIAVTVQNHQPLGLEETEQAVLRLLRYRLEPLEHEALVHFNLAIKGGGGEGDLRRDCTPVRCQSMLAGKQCVLPYGHVDQHVSGSGSRCAVILGGSGQCYLEAGHSGEHSFPPVDPTWGARGIPER